MQCPRCQSERVIKNGRIHTAKPKWMCKDCTANSCLTHSGAASLTKRKH